jgi:hypothetical protein
MNQGAQRVLGPEDLHRLYHNFERPAQRTLSMGCSLTSPKDYSRRRVYRHGFHPLIPGSLATWRGQGGAIAENVGFRDPPGRAKVRDGYTSTGHRY